MKVLINKRNWMLKYNTVIVVYQEKSRVEVKFMPESKELFSIDYA